MRTCSSCLLLLLTLSSCKKAEVEAEAAPLAVQLGKVVRGEVADLVDAAGTLEAPPGLDVKLGPLVAGRLASLLAAEGDRVRKGQLLASLDLSPLRDAVAQAEAQLATSRAQEQNATAREGRARQAVAAGVAAVQEAEDAQLQLESARAAVQSAQAALSTARNQLQRGELRAPFDGVVARLLASAGEPVDPSRPVLEVARVDTLELRAPVAPRLALKLRPGQRAVVTVDALPGLSFPGAVLAVAPVVDPQSGALLVRVRVPNGDGALKVGSLARARITVDAHRAALLVPREALLGGEAGPAVERVEQGKAHRVAVKLGLRDDAHVELLEGVSEGESVIVQGAYAVPDGTPIAEPPTGQAKAAAEAPDAEKAGARGER